jgi:hypothetical protein
MGVVVPIPTRYNLRCFVKKSKTTKVKNIFHKFVVATNPHWPLIWAFTLVLGLLIGNIIFLHRLSREVLNFETEYVNALEQEAMNGYDDTFHDTITNTFNKMEKQIIELYADNEKLTQYVQHQGKVENSGRANGG